MAIGIPGLVNGTATNSDDFLFGTQGIDIIGSRGGSDIVYGLGGEDTIDGGGNDDELHGGSDTDFIQGGTGDDRLFGDDGNDTLFGWRGDDVLHGGGEDDYLTGGPGFDRLFGGDNDDQFDWNNGDGSDEVDGGSGDDILHIGDSNAGGTDSFVGSIFELGPNTLDTIGGPDDLTPLATSAILNRIDSATDDEPFRIEISNTEVVEINGGGGADFLRMADLSGTGIRQVILNGGDGAERVNATASSTPVTVFGDANSDFIAGSQGDDDLNGGDRGDRIFGDGGNDIVNGDDGDDSLAGGRGNDTIGGGSGNDTLNGGAGDDVLDGEDNQDVISFDFAPSGPAGIGNDILTFDRFLDDIRLVGIPEDDVDTNGDGFVNDADGLVSIVNGDLVLGFGADDSITIVGSNGLPIDSLTVGSNIFFA